MKTNFMKVSTWAMALCASMAVFTACNDDENGTTPPPAPSVENLGGIVTENMTLTANTEYKLTSQLQVKPPQYLPSKKLRRERQPRAKILFTF